MTTTESSTRSPERLDPSGGAGLWTISTPSTRTDFDSAALERTRERFGSECGIESILLARLDGFTWSAHRGAR